MAYGQPIDGQASVGDVGSVFYLEQAGANSQKDVDADGAKFNDVDADQIGSMIEYWSDGTRWHCFGYAVHQHAITQVDHD